MSEDNNNADDDGDVIGELPDGPGFGLGRIRSATVLGGDPEGGTLGNETLSPDSIVIAGAAAASMTATAGSSKSKRSAPLDWSLVSRLTRATWEKSQASCCLGMVLQNRCEE